ncbi:hypothetical protein PR202_gb06656 [Eleusine coracana subsp. coracana]|uniref:Uncharacterized protein n=1 Tax=Eleusine coracana subsp. coracana TaxID=191504 RepID=A0AAV5E9E7_ELECO|nr:hypothetical protein PR202_gb06656 [Eleusine coracana subsp. coracana]
MARLQHLVSRALASQQLLLPSPTTSSLRLTPRPPIPPLSPPPSSPLYGRTLLPFSVASSRKYASANFGRRRRASSPPMLLRRRRARRPTRKGPGELSVQIGIEEDLPDDPEILVIASSIAEMLRTDVGKAVKLAFANLEVSEYKTRDTCISNVNKYDSMELQLGDIVISVETARRQAEERGHTLVDEIRILMVSMFYLISHYDEHVTSLPRVPLSSLPPPAAATFPAPAMAAGLPSSPLVFLPRPYTDPPRVGRCGCAPAAAAIDPPAGGLDLPAGGPNPAARGPDPHAGRGSAAAAALAGAAPGTVGAAAAAGYRACRTGRRRRERRAGRRRRAPAPAAAAAVGAAPGPATVVTAPGPVAALAALELAAADLAAVGADPVAAVEAPRRLTAAAKGKAVDLGPAFVVAVACPPLPYGMTLSWMRSPADSRQHRPQRRSWLPHRPPLLLRPPLPTCHLPPRRYFASARWGGGGAAVVATAVRGVVVGAPAGASGEYLRSGFYDLDSSNWGFVLVILQQPMVKAHLYVALPGSEGRASSSALARGHVHRPCSPGSGDLDCPCSAAYLAGGGGGGGGGLDPASAPQPATDLAWGMGPSGSGSVFQHLGPDHADVNSNIEKMSHRQKPQTKLSHIICDIDGTLVDHDGCLHEESIESLRDVIAEGVNVIMVTGKSRVSTVRTFKLHNPQGKDVLISETSPGVFLQGSLVYARHGQEIYRADLDANICKEIKVMPSIEDLLEYSSIQKLLFFDNVEEGSSVLVHHCSELTKGKARVIQIQPHSIEIVPHNASKGHGLRILLDHLGITEDVRLHSNQMNCTYCSFICTLHRCVSLYIKRLKVLNTFSLQFFVCMYSLILMLRETISDG